MAPSPRSPSPFVPGAWPSSPSPKSRQRLAECSPSDLHYLRSRLPTTDLHYRKAGSQHGTYTIRISGANPAISSAADNTLSSFTSDGLGFHSSPANTSFSSAYTNLTPTKSSFSPPIRFTKSKDGSEQQHDTNTKEQSPGRSLGKQYDTSGVLARDQTYLSLPEIPDLSSLSSLRDELRISRDEFNVSSNEPVSRSFLDETFLDLRTTPLKKPSLDTLSSSSIQFRQTRMVRSDSLEFDAEPSCFPQPDGRNSWTLFLDPKSVCSEELPPSQTRNSLTLVTSESGCRATTSTLAHVRRSWRVGSNLPPGFFLTQEETSTRRYANDVLEKAFHVRDGESSLALKVSESTCTSGRGAIRPSSTDDPPAAGVRHPQKKFLQAMKRMKTKMQRIFRKLSSIEHSPLQAQKSPAPNSFQHVMNGHPAVDPDLSQPLGSGKHKRLRVQSIQIPRPRTYDKQNFTDSLHCRARLGRAQLPQRPISLPCRPYGQLSHRSRHTNRLPNECSRIRAQRRVTGEDHEVSQVETWQETLRSSQRRSFLSCIDIQSS